MMRTSIRPSAAAAARADAARYRQLAQERRAAGDAKIADKLMELVRDLEAKAERMERALYCGAS